MEFRSGAIVGVVVAVNVVDSQVNRRMRGLCLMF
jgi:hypothetical protein